MSINWSWKKQPKTSAYGEDMEIELGMEVRDKITGFQGITTGRITYLYGCDQYSIVPPAVDGKIQNAEWFDEGRIEIVGPGIAPEEVQVEKNGGTNRDAPRIR